MKKILFIVLTFFTLFLSGCSSPVDSRDSISQKKYTWVPVKFSDKSNFLNLRKDLTLEGNTVVAYSDSGTGDGARLNWSCPNLGMDWNASGIDIDIWCNENTQSAGVQWWDPSFGGMKFFWFYFTSSGAFGITKCDYNEETKVKSEKGICYLSADKINVKKNELNNLKIFMDDFDNINVYLNQEHIYTIPSDKIMFTKGRFFIVYQLIAGRKYTSNNPASARFILNRQQLALY